jgi:hypothetical protein
MSEDVKGGSSNAKRLQALMREIQEVQEMVEEDMNQKTADRTGCLGLNRISDRRDILGLNRNISGGAENLRLKRRNSDNSLGLNKRISEGTNSLGLERRISNPYTLTQNTENAQSRSQTTREDKSSSANTIKNDGEPVHPRSQKHIGTHSDVFPSNFSANKNLRSDEQYQTFHGAQCDDLQATTVHSRDLNDFCSKKGKSTPDLNLKEGESQMRALQNHGRFSRVQASPPSSGGSKFRKSPGGKHQQQVGGKRGITLAGNSSRRDNCTSVLCEESNENRISVSTPEHDSNSHEGQRGSDDLSEDFCSVEDDKGNRGDEAEGRTSSNRNAGADARLRRRKNLHKVEELMKVNSPQCSGNDRPQPFPVEISDSRGRNEKRVDNQTSDRNLQRAGRKTVPKKRLMFSNALQMKKKRKKDPPARDIRERPIVSTQEGRRVFNNNASDPFQFLEQQTSTSVKNRLPFAKDDQCSSDSQEDMHQQYEKDKVGLGQETLHTCKPVHVKRRQRFSLDFSPVERKNTKKKDNLVQNM